MDAPLPFDFQLQQYRNAYLTPSALLAWLAAKDRRKGLLAGMTGLGKSTAVRNLLADPRLYEHFDQVVCMVDQNRVLAEYESDLRHRLPASIAEQLVVLRARPATRCGARNEEWATFEKARCGALGRSHLCSGCDDRGACPWPEQGDPSRLRDARLVLGVQEFLRVHPTLLEARDGVRKLVIIEEPRDVTGSTTARIDQRVLEAFRRAIADVASMVVVDDDRRALDGLVRCIEHLRSRADLSRLPRTPGLGPHLVARIEETGFRIAPGRFHNALPYLHTLQRHYPRWYDERRNACFRDTLPLKPHTVLISTAGSPAQLVRQKMALPDLEIVLDQPTPVHPGTHYVNLRSFAGARNRFPGNKKRLLDFAAEVAARALTEGKRVLLVSCKEFEDDCRQEMASRLAAITGATVPIYMASGPDEVVADDVRVALIHYGMTGANTFGDFDVCICLNSYYAPPQAVADHLSDVLPNGMVADVRVDVDGQGDRRVVADSDSLAVQELAQDIFYQVEALAVLQAIGRCRPNTRRRTVFLMHCGDLRLGREEVVHTLDDARRVFGLTNPRKRQRVTTASKVSGLMADGLNAGQVASQLGVSKATVYRLRKESHEI